MAHDDNDADGTELVDVLSPDIGILLVHSLSL
jgi:hypothetical protein